MTRGGITVLSLFDGMSCGQIALARTGVPVKEYYASEIDKYAIAVTQHNYPDTLQLGDINEWRTWDIPWADIDLIQGGSPCQGFSFAGKQLAFNDPRSKLFFVMHQIILYVNMCRHEVGKEPVKFLVENVRMKQEYLDVMTDYLGVKPVCINSALVSAQNRVRYYWTNIAEIEQPQDKGILLRDIVENGFVDRLKSLAVTTRVGGATVKRYLTKKLHQMVMLKRPKVYVNQRPRGFNQGGIKKDQKSTPITANSWQQNNKLVYENVEWRKLKPVECERLQTVPDNYTLVPHPVFKNRKMSNHQRYKMLGNGWTVDVIRHIYNKL